MLIEWKKEYNTNIPVIDGQHKNLIGLINKLHDKENANYDHDFLYDVFEKLVQYTKVHFSFEEQMLKEQGYPEVEKHNAEHAVFVIKLAEYLKNSRRADFHVSEEISKFLEHWFVNHILKNDIEYSKYLGKYKGS